MKFQTLIPLFLLPLAVACQSAKTHLGYSKDSEDLNISPKETVELELDNTPKTNSQTKSTANKANFSNNTTVKKTKSLAAMSKFKKDETPQIGSIVSFSDNTEDSNSEALDSILDDNSTPTDDAVLADSPDSFLKETNLSNQSNPLLCDDNVFYNSWAMQFNNQWLAKYGKIYPSNAKRHKALAQARTNEFIRLVYPEIEKTGYDLPIVLNSQVLAWIGYFTGAGRKNFVVWLQRGKTLIPQMQKILEQNGLPSDLVYLSMIESGYSMKALSNVGAVGLWQFMPGTARDYGLRINDWVDERRDPEKSTFAASRYLNDLYSKFGSWHLAAAGYNGGPGLVSKKLRAYGSTASFFELTSKKAMNNETANYVPKILGAMIIAKNPNLFGFDTAQINTTPQTKKIPISRSVALSDIANTIQVDEKILEGLNPQLRFGITPPANATSNGQFNLVVPSSKADVLLASLDKIPEAPNTKLVAARIKHHEKALVFVKRYRLNMSSFLSANTGLKANSSLRKGQVVYVSVTLGSGQYDKLTAEKRGKHKKKYTAKLHKHKSYAHKSKKQKVHGIAYAK